MTVLSQEIDSIHHANRLFWEQATAYGRKAKVDYYYRQDRLEEIRSEMAELSDVGEWSRPTEASMRLCVAKGSSFGIAAPPMKQNANDCAQARNQSKKRRLDRRLPMKSN